MAPIKISGYRPIEEVEQSTEQLRGVWWSLVPQKPLPGWKSWLVVLVLALIFLSQGSAVGILLAIAIVVGWYFYLKKLKQSNDVPIQATSREVLRREIQEAIRKSERQMLLDLGISEDEYRDAKSSMLVINMPSGDGPVRTDAAPGIFRTINNYVAIVTPKGLGYFIGSYDTVTQRFAVGDRELLMWNRVARVRISGHNLSIEAQSGSPLTFPMDPTTLISVDGYDDAIDSRANPFVLAAQKRLQGS